MADPQALRQNIKLFDDNKNSQTLLRTLFSKGEMSTLWGQMKRKVRTASESLQSEHKQIVQSNVRQGKQQKLNHMLSKGDAHVHLQACRSLSHMLRGSA